MWTVDGIVIVKKQTNILIEINSTLAAMMIVRSWFSRFYLHLINLLFGSFRYCFFIDFINLHIVIVLIFFQSLSLPWIDINKAQLEIHLIVQTLEPPFLVFVIFILKKNAIIIWNLLGWKIVILWIKLTLELILCCLF